MDKYVVSYAQNREDVILSSFFLKQKRGFYVDIGANDPSEHSVTKYFYERGWRGINIEPNPGLHKRLVDERTRDTNLNVGISNKRGTLPFREYEGHGLSTFSLDAQEENERTGHPLTRKYKDYEVSVRTLQDVFAEYHPSQIDFMKIDVEGYEYEVIAGNDWAVYRPTVLCIEANHIHKDWRPLLQKNGYEKIFNDGLNDYYVDVKKKVKFEYIPAMIGRQVVPSYIKDDLERNVLENESLRDEARLWKNAAREKDDEIEKLNDYIAESARLKSLLRALVGKIDAIIIFKLRNKTKMRYYYPPLPEPQEQEDAAELLSIVQQADRVSFTTKPPYAQRVQIAIFKGTLKAYILCRRMLFKALRTLVRVVRRKGKANA